MTKPDILSAIEPVVDALEKCGIPWYTGGSIASSAYGMARATLDVDLVADMKLEQAQEFSAMLSASYYVDADMIRDAIRRRSSFNVIHLGTLIKVDIFILKTRPFDSEAFRRRRVDTLDEEHGGVNLYLASPEDTVLHKLLWYKMGAGVSDRQWFDCIGVLKVQGALLDFEYMRRWAAELGIDDLLARAFAETGL